MAPVAKPKTTYTRVELYVGYHDNTWDCARYVYVPNDLMLGWAGDGLMKEDVAVEAYKRYIEKSWKEAQRDQIAFVGVYSMVTQDEEGNDARPRKDDVQVTHRDMKKAAARRGQ
jgi:hypothetical protein